MLAYVQLDATPRNPGYDLPPSRNALCSENNGLVEITRRGKGPAGGMGLGMLLQRPAVTAILHLQASPSWSPVGQHANRNGLDDLGPFGPLRALSPIIFTDDWL